MVTMYDVLLDHAGHSITLDVRGTSNAVALDCVDCDSMIFIEKQLTDDNERQ